jgi:hypothetical protein
MPSPSWATHCPRAAARRRSRAEHVKGKESHITAQSSGTATHPGRSGATGSAPSADSRPRGYSPCGHPARRRPSATARKSRQSLPVCRKARSHRNAWAWRNLRPRGTRQGAVLISRPVTGLWGGRSPDDTADTRPGPLPPRARQPQPVWRGVALLHSFWYEEALKRLRLTATDPTGRRLLGIAMSVHRSGSRRARRCWPRVRRR